MLEIRISLNHVNDRRQDNDPDPVPEIAKGAAHQREEVAEGTVVDLGVEAVLVRVIEEETEEGVDRETEDPTEEDTTIEDDRDPVPVIVVVRHRVVTLVVVVLHQCDDLHVEAHHEVVSPVQSVVTSCHSTPVIRHRKTQNSS